MDPNPGKSSVIKYHFPNENTDMTTENIITWVRKYLSGSLIPYYKSDKDVK